MLSRTTLGVTAGVVGAFIMYCIYFDRKRRSDPNFKKKLKESMSLIQLNNNMYLNPLFALLQVNMPVLKIFLFKNIS